MSEGNKRFYWLKLSDDFFRQKEIKQLRRIAGGDLYTIIYLKMLLCSMDTGGKLYYEGISDDFASELALDIDEEVENVRVTIQFLISKGILIETTVDDEVFPGESASGDAQADADFQKLMQSLGVTEDDLFTDTDPGQDVDEDGEGKS